jgi:hypothetical protein
MRIVGFTGHRLSKLEGNAKYNQIRLRDLAKAVLNKFEPDVIICGMEWTGWDRAVAEVASWNERILIHAAIPYDGHENKYRDFLPKCTFQTHVSSGAYSAKKMQLRNQFIVDTIKDRGPLIALWDGSGSGTGNACRYAEEQGVKVINVWNSWIKYKDQ